MNNNHPPTQTSSALARHVADLITLLGNDVLLLPWPHYTKGTNKPWGHRSVAVDMQNPEYLAELGRGNIGVVLGPKSGNLVSIDIDHDKFVEPFLELNPIFRSTLQSKGKDGCNFWVRMDGAYKSTFYLYCGEDDWGEFRSGPANTQTIIYGLHKDTRQPYQILNRVSPITIREEQIVWPAGVTRTKPKKEPTIYKLHRRVEGSEGSEGNEVVVEGCQALSWDTLLTNDCIPTGESQNHHCLFLLAQRVRGLEVQDRVEIDRLKKRGLIKNWFSRAQPHATKSEEDYFMEFMAAYADVKFPTGATFKAAIQKARSEQPADAQIFEDESKKVLVALCYHLQQFARDQPFFIDGRTCHRYMPERCAKTWHDYIRALTALKIIDRVEKGYQGHSSRYRWLGLPEMRTTVHTE